MINKQTTLLKIGGIAEETGIHLWLYGSYAVELISGITVNPNGDLDLATDSLDDCHKMVTVLISKGWESLRAFEWEASPGRNAYNAILRDTITNQEIDISYIKGEEGIFHGKNTINIKTYGSFMHIFSPAELLVLYKKFGHEKPEFNKEKIDILERIISEGEIDIK